MRIKKKKKRAERLSNCGLVSFVFCFLSLSLSLSLSSSCLLVALSVSFLFFSKLEHTCFKFDGSLTSCLLDCLSGAGGLCPDV